MQEHRDLPRIRGERDHLKQELRRSQEDNQGLRLQFQRQEALRAQLIQVFGAL